MSANRQNQQRIGVPPELVKDYIVNFKLAGKKIYQTTVKNNHLRHNVLNFETVICDEIEFHITELNGAKQVTIFEIRAY
jgi:hypothetical protein